MRDLPSSTTDLVAENGSYPIDFIEIYTDPDDRFNTASSVRLSTGFKSFDITAGGETTTYNPAQQLLGIASLDETADVKTNSIVVTLAGLDSTVVQNISGIDVVGSIAILYRGYFDMSDGTLATPYERWKGLISSYAYTEEDNGLDSNVTYQISCKNLVAALLESQNGRYSSVSSFQRKDADDMSMEFVETLAEWNPRFGKED